MPLTFIHPCPTSVMLGNSRFVVSYRTIALMPYKGYGYAARFVGRKFTTLTVLSLVLPF